MQTAIATVSLSGTLNEKLEAIAAARFKGVEIFENDLLSFNGTPAEVRRIIDALGLRAITFQPFRDFEGMPEAQRQKAFSRAERKFDVMQELGCDLLLVCSNISAESLGRRSARASSTFLRCAGSAAVSSILSTARQRSAISGTLISSQSRRPRRAVQGSSASTTSRSRCTTRRC
jgi:4-hydroxyphenylpyruvate dioxygenase